jgi:cell division protein FtsL
MAAAHREPAAGTAVLRSPALPVVLLLAALAIGVTALLPLIQSSSATSTASEVRDLEAQRNDERARLRALELEIARLGSLSRIEQEAATRFKMAPPQVQNYIAVDAPGPQPRKIPSRYLAPPSEDSSDSPSLFEDIMDFVTP